MKQKLIRLKAGALALIMSMSLTGCGEKFNYKTGENNKYEVSDDSYINNGKINKLYIAEVYNELTQETKLYIVERLFFCDIDSEGYIYHYNDILTPNSVFFKDNNELNNFIKLKQLINLEDYINALGLTQYKYSYEDMQRILEQIESVHEYLDENSNELILN